MISKGYIGLFYIMTPEECRQKYGEEVTGRSQLKLVAHEGTLYQNCKHLFGKIGLFKLVGFNACHLKDLEGVGFRSVPIWAAIPMEEGTIFDDL